MYHIVVLFDNGIARNMVEVILLNMQLDVSSFGSKETFEYLVNHGNDI